MMTMSYLAIPEFPLAMNRAVSPPPDKLLQGPAPKGKKVR
jgi:hypothetical protein